MELNRTSAIPVVVVSRDADIVRAAQAAAAAAGVPLTTASEADDVRAAWQRAPTVLIGEDMCDVARWGLPSRSRVYLVGLRAAGDLGRYSMPLGASVIVLPDGAPWLTRVITGSGGVGGTVVAVRGGSGGVGASTLAVGVALQAARDGHRVALVDGDPLGGGLDLVVGAEAQRGWRWNDLTDATGQLADISAMLPAIDGVSLLSWGRGSADSVVSDEAIQAVLDVLARHHDLVVVDTPRDAVDLARWATKTLVVSARSVRGVAAARDVVRSSDGVGAAVLRAGQVPLRQVREALGAPVVCVVPHVKHLAELANEGLPPVVGGAWARANREALAWILDEGGRDGRRRRS